MFRGMEEYIENGYDTPGLEQAVERALPMLEQAEAVFLSNVERENATLTAASNAVNDMKSELKRLDDAKRQLLGGTSSRGRARTKTAKTMEDDGGKLDGLMDEIVNAKCTMKN